MATDHSQLGQKLQQLASNLGVTLPPDLKPEQQALVSRLEKLSGKTFDREYIKEMVTDHAKDVSEFERAVTQASNADIKQVRVRGAADAARSLEDGARDSRQAGRQDSMTSPRAGYN